MTALQYEKLSAPFRTGKRMKALKFMNKALTTLGYTAYPMILAWLYFTGRPEWICAVMVPGLGFVLLTAVRKMINRPRPYEALDIQPIIHKDTKGKSMPSRHVFSMTIIAVTAFIVSSLIGAVLILCSALLAVIRAVAGVHYPSDVAVGFLSAVVWGVVWYGILI